ncbi:hypothetical protein [Halorubrum salsamenti]|uniref:hypothetical protein n=1 Tax=Halorubrum salsamenti TaxID=2583990 RepID=UPI0016423B52|nr:hypothetical protein [Halorubrum salsamenti]
MSRLRHVLFVIMLFTATVAVASSGAFSATAVERGVSIETAEDPNAYLGFEQTQYSNDENVTTNLTQRDDGNETTNVTQSTNGTSTGEVNETQGTDGNETASVTQHTIEDGTANVDVTVTNQFPARTELTTVEITANNTSVDLVPLASGERATHNFPSVPCGDSIGIAASGDGVTVHLERTVTCS